MEEEGEVSDQEVAEQQLEQQEQTYWETIRGVMIDLMGWKQMPEFESSYYSLDENPFAGTITPLTVKVSVKLPWDE